MPGKRAALNKPWYDTQIVNCSYCGIMIAREFWADDEFPGERFCEEACADVKRRLAAEASEIARTPAEASSDV